jgi:hypothetical protein
MFNKELYSDPNPTYHNKAANTATVMIIWNDIRAIRLELNFQPVPSESSLIHSTLNEWDKFFMGKLSQNNAPISLSSVRECLLGKDTPL